MFFSKLILPVVAIFGLMTFTFATPIATNELIARTDSSDVITHIQGVDAALVPLLAKLTADIKADVSIVADVNAVANVFISSTAFFKGLPVDILVDADVDVYVSATVDIFVKLLASVSLIGILNLSIFAQIDAFLSAWVSAFASIHADIVVKIGPLLPIATVNVFVSAKLILTATVLGLVNILGLLSL